MLFETSKKMRNTLLGNETIDFEESQQIKVNSKKQALEANNIVVQLVHGSY